MSNRLSEALESLKNLAQIHDAPCGASLPALKNNTHIHLPPNFSAFETVEHAMNLAAEQGLGVMGVGNYYDYRIYADYIEMAIERGIFPLFGLEIISLVDELVRTGVKVNDPGNPGKFYVCGKGITRFDQMTDRATALLERIRTADSQRMAEMTIKISDIFISRDVRLQLTEKDVIDMIVQRHGSPRDSVTIQERHIAQAFQEALFRLIEPSERAGALQKGLGTTCAKPQDAVAVQNDIRSHLMKAGKPAFVKESFVTLEEARELILELGGIPCYPTLADGTNPICDFEAPIEHLIANATERGLHAAEFIPNRNSAKTLREYAVAMREAGMVVTAGTEHNSLSLIPLEPTCAGTDEIPADVQEIFWEGACVVAAHQFMGLNGETGFVTTTGELNPAFANADERIKKFAAIGADIIAQYRKATA